MIDMMKSLNRISKRRFFSFMILLKVMLLLTILSTISSCLISIEFKRFYQPKNRHLRVLIEK